MSSLRGISISQRPNMTLQRRTPHRKVSLKKQEKKRTSTFAWPMAMADILKANKDVTTAAKMTSKPRKKLKARSPNNKGGQVAMFKRIWDSRPHKCEVCGAHIEEATASNFSHLLPKGTYPDFKLREDNIVIKCKNCHDNWHLWGQRVLSVVPMWKAVVAQFRALRDEANNANR
jgi:5-methylcytosine-specific restriction endonuclease McrA